MFRTFTTRQIYEGFYKIFYDFKIHRIYNNGLNSCVVDIENYNVLNGRRRMDNISHIITVSQTYRLKKSSTKLEIEQELENRSNTKVMYISAKDNYIYYKFDTSPTSSLYVYENNSVITESINKGNYDPNILNKIVELLFRDQSRYDLFNNYDTLARITITQGFIKKERITSCNLNTIPKVLNKYSAYTTKFTSYFVFGFLEVRVYEHNISHENNSGYFKIKVKNINNKYTENFSIRYTYSYKNHNLDCYDIFLTGYNQHSMVISIPKIKNKQNKFSTYGALEEYDQTVIFFLLYKYYKSIY